MSVTDSKSLKPYAKGYKHALRPYGDPERMCSRK